MKELLTLALSGVIIMLADILNFRRLVFPLAVLGLTTTISWSIYDWGTNETLLGNSTMLVVNNYALGFLMVLCTTCLMWLFMADDYFGKVGSSTDRLALVMFSMVGAFLMVSFNNLVMLFLGVEILSVALYVLAGSDKINIRSNESALKYFLMGSFASGFLLFGIALIYGATGSFDIQLIRSNLTSQLTPDSTMLSTALIMLIIGLGFKVSAAPFHFWAPDVYQGAPTPVTAFMATIVKTAAFAAFFRLFMTSFAALNTAFSDIIMAMTVLTLLIGNVVAAAQTDAKRMLAYSSISHAGYMLLALLTFSASSANAILLYAASYSVATIVGFLILYVVSENKGSMDLTAFNGLGKKNLPLAIAMTMSLLSMAGIPPMAGFMGKYFIFAGAIEKGYLNVVIFAVLMSLVGVYYYMKIIINMFLNDTDEAEAIKTNSLQNILIVLGCAALIALGLFPSLIYNTVGKLM